jgi:hypothetical protein
MKAEESLAIMWLSYANIFRKWRRKNTFFNSFFQANISLARETDDRRRKRQTTYIPS